MLKSRRIVFILISLLILVSLGAFWAASGKQQAYQANAFLMDTFIDVKFYGRYGKAAADALFSRLEAFEKNNSLYLPGSDIDKLAKEAGSGNPVEIHPETLSLLQTAKEYSMRSEHTFDITIAPLSLLWGITSEHPQVPRRSEIEETLGLVQADDLILDPVNGTGQLAHSGQAVDLGGIAKGAAASIVFEVMDAYGVRNGYVSLGGNMAVRGGYPNGKDFRFGVRDPRGNGAEYFATLSLRGKTMATTGDYERYFEEGNVRYHHILDPRTGYPARSDLISVSIVSEDGALADFLSTAFFVAGRESALKHMKDRRFSIILVDDALNVYASKSLEGNLIPNAEKPQYKIQYIA